MSPGHHFLPRVADRLSVRLIVYRSNPRQRERGLYGVAAIPQDFLK